MKYYKDESLANFPFWSGAKTNADKLTYEELEKIGDELEWQDVFGGRVPSDTEVNDLFWFDFDFVCNLIGLTEKEVDARE